MTHCPFYVLTSHPTTQPSEPLPRRKVSADWAAINLSNFDPSRIATDSTHNAIDTLDYFFGGGEPPRDLPDDCVHLIVTAKSQKQQQNQEDENEALDLMAEMQKSEA